MKVYSICIIVFFIFIYSNNIFIDYSILNNIN